MANIWFKTKEWHDYNSKINSAMLSAESPEGVLLHEKLRDKANAYHEGSRAYIDVEISESELDNLRIEFEDAKIQMDAWLESLTADD